MKLFEIVFNTIRIFLPPLSLFVHRKIKHLVGTMGENVNLLDVGGRKSHHTINVPATITVTDIPRKSDTQKNLNLGVNNDIIEQLNSRRTNIKNYIIDDMTETKLPKESYDIIMAIEVLEHVLEDEVFVGNIYDTLKPGGVFFMTTPNGEHVENTNPDHVRHYSRSELESVLKKSFNNVDVTYIIYESKSYFNSQKSWSIKHPFRTIVAMISGVLSNYQSNMSGKEVTADNSRHLSAVAFKS